MTESVPIPGVSLGRRLAVGGMGELFLAERERPDGRREACVVKRLLPGAGEAERFLFEREARALAAADGADTGVVRVLASHPDALVLEHVDGVDLGTLLDARRKRGRPLPVGAALAAVAGLARGLATLGRLGIVHRDVHPGNVLLGRDGRVCVADLGVATFSAEAGPTIAGLKGTLAYMAPEQLRDGVADLRSDLYGAGLVAYEALTGALARPGGAVGLVELLRARERLPARPGEVRPELAPLDDALLAALAPDPAARPAGVTAWLDGLLAAARAAGMAPDRSALAAAVDAVAGASGSLPFAGPSRTTNLSGAGPVVTQSPTAVTRAAAPPEPRATGAAGAAGAGGAADAPGRRVRWAWVVGPMVVGAGALGAWAALRPASPPSEPVAGRSLSGLSTVAAPRLAVADATSDTGIATHPDAVAAVVDAPALEDAVAEVAVAEDAVAEVAVAEAPDVARSPDATGRAPSDAAATTAPSARRRVHFEGAVHVAGGGVRGLAPGPSWVMGDGDIVTVRVVGGAPPFGARVRLASKDGGLRVNVAAEAGQVYEASCGARRGPTPLVGLRVARGGSVACRLDATNGATMAFVVVDGSE